LKEKALYPSIERFLMKQSNCFRTAQRVGTMFVGIADVVGVRDVGGDARGDVEVISVEVKLRASNFGKIVGQALGYSLLAHRCYLAAHTEFSEEQKELANRLGVGLIEIRRRYNNWSCVQVQSSANFTPHPHQLETLLRRGFGLARCAVCEVFSDISAASRNWRRAVDDEKPFIEWREPDRKLMFSKRWKGDWRRVYVCKDCVQSLWKDLVVEKDLDRVEKQLNKRIDHSKF
jgi:hypothetical protein